MPPQDDRASPGRPSELTGRHDCGFAALSGGYAGSSPPPRRAAAIPTVRIEAPTSGTATQLVSDLVPFARTDVLPLADDRWEILVEDSTDDELDAVMLAVARWAVACELEQRSVLVDGEPIELPEPPATA